MKKLVILACVCGLTSSCYTVSIVSPKGSNISIASTSDICSDKDSVKNWYVLWGLVPLNRRATSELMGEKSGKVKIETKMKFVDFLISAILGTFTSVVATTTEIKSCL